MTIKLIYKRRPQPGTLYPILIEFSIYKPYEQQWTEIDKKKLFVHLFLAPLEAQGVALSVVSPLFLSLTSSSCLSLGLFQVCLWSRYAPSLIILLAYFLRQTEPKILRLFEPF